nr:lipopolysaccharide core biosynthesis glycosyltransferase lpsD [uncultured bacterium]
MTMQLHDFESSDRDHRPRVLFVINSLTGGGAERVMTTLLSNSKDRLERYDIALAVLDDVPRAFQMPEWLMIFQLDCKGGTLASIRGIEQVVRTYDPDVTLSFLTRANFASCAAMMKLRRPRIISERTSTPAHLGSTFRQAVTKALMRALYSRATRVIAVSSGVADKLSSGFGVRSNLIEVIPNPVDFQALNAAAADRQDIEVEGPYIAAVGRLVSVKNYALLIRAFAAANLACKLVIAGEGPQRDALAELAAELRIADRVIMPGWLRNPYALVSNASLFALSSDIEGFPNALVEALALGVPAVATNCKDGPAEILARSGADRISGLSVRKRAFSRPSATSTAMPRR